jgi:hypothetical protein
MLSKSDLLSLLQCPRKLWLEKHHPDEIPQGTTSQERRTMDGHLVNEKARSELGKTFIWPQGRDDPQRAMDDALASLAAAPNTPVVEMPMYREGLYCRADALVPVEGGYALRETKASTFPLKTDKVTPDKPKDHFVTDIAIQAWVAEATGLPIVNCDMNLLNSRWTYRGDGDYEGLFRLQNVDALMAARKTSVPVWLEQARTTIDGPMPDTKVGSHCKKPHDCAFVTRCKAMEPALEAHPVELLPDLAGKNLAKELRSKGFASLPDVPREFLAGNREAMYWRIQAAHLTGEAVLEKGTVETLSALPYPRYYFDFEGIDLPVPRWTGVRPYEQIPFQWSCHVERTPGVFEHHAFLDVSGNDPSLACIERMREVIDETDGGPLLVFFQTYEKGRLKELGERHPEFKELTEVYISRLFDLHPLVKDNYYHPDMKGSFSIKKVLPTIAPDLRYEDLEDIREGTGAQVGYLHAAFSPLGKKAREKLVRNALAYCEQDTWAMVVIGLFLESRPRVATPSPDMSPMLLLGNMASKERGNKVAEDLSAVEFEDVDF